MEQWNEIEDLQMAQGWEDGTLLVLVMQSLSLEDYTKVLNRIERVAAEENEGDTPYAWIVDEENPEDFFGEKAN